MRSTRKLVGGIVAVLALTCVAPVAADGPPIGGCPVPFMLVSLESLGLGDLNGAPSLDGNGDGLTCIKPLPKGGVVFRDNTVQAQP